MTAIPGFRNKILTAIAVLLACAALDKAAIAADPGAPQLDAGLRAAEAVRAVKRLQHTYTFYLNDGLWTDAADLFTANATAQFGTDTVNGRDALRQYLMGRAGRKHCQQRHPDTKQCETEAAEDARGVAIG